MDTLRLDQTGGVLTITLNRPDRLNAINGEMLYELTTALGDAETDSAVRAILLTGEGRAFCAGQDLKMDVGDLDYGEHLRATYNPLIRQMHHYAKPIVAAINGVAAGAGLSLALGADLRVAAEEAALSLGFVKIGLVPDSGASWLLPRLIGHARALELALTGRTIDAATAHEWGLVNQVAPDAAEAGHELATTLAQGATRAMGLTKALFTYGATATLEEALEQEAQMQVAASQTADHIEGVTAFIEKRPPNFTGR